MATKPILRGPRGIQGKIGKTGRSGSPGKNGIITPEIYKELGTISAKIDGNDEFHRNLLIDLNMFRDDNQKQHQELLRAISAICTDVTEVKTDLAVKGTKININTNRLDKLEPDMVSLKTASATISGKMAIILIGVTGFVSLIWTVLGHTIGKVSGLIK